MTAYQTVRDALTGLGYDVRKYPGKTDDQTYIALSMQGVETTLWAGDQWKRGACTLQVELYTRDAMDGLLDAVTAALMMHGIVIARIGAESYAEDTGIRYVPILCEVPIFP